MTKKTCEVAGVTYVAHPQGEPIEAAPFGSLLLCTGCVAHPAQGQHNSGLCIQLDDCVPDNIIWVVKV